jgi:hypothetical protein
VPVIENVVGGPYEAERRVILLRMMLSLGAAAIVAARTFPARERIF